jgi:glc operon protein GlcG
VDYERAMTFVTMAKSLAAKDGVECSVAVLDAAGHPVVLARGKADAWHGPYMAAGKARLAAAFRKSTAQLLDGWADRPLYPMSLTEIIPGGVTLNKGGYPIFMDGECVGAIGVGGGSPDVDDSIARRTVEALAAWKK